MRELTLLLLLANLGLLAWGLWLAPEDAPQPVVATAPESKVPRLVLLSELPGAASADPQNEPVNAGGASDPPNAGEEDAIDAGTRADVETTETSGEIETSEPITPGTVALITRPPAPRCVSIGPFLDLAETAEAAARLREQGHTPSQRLADSPVWVGNWVYLGPFSTREAAIGAAESLRDRGVTDLYVEQGGEQQNTVSLGLFSDRERAETLASAVRKLGVTPQISDRFRVASVYWVDIVVTANVTLSAVDYQVRPGRVVQVEERECAEGTASPGTMAERVPNG